jgi:hypothetical protein
MAGARFGIAITLAAGAAVLLGCAGPSAFEAFVDEYPPCDQPPLSEEDVRSIVARYFATKGESARVPQGLRSRVVEYRCVYIYEESEAFDTLAHSFEIFVDRSGRVLPLYLLPERPD